MESKGIIVSSALVILAGIVCFTEAAHLPSSLNFQVSLEEPCATGNSTHPPGGGLSPEQRSQLLGDIAAFVLPPIGQQASVLKDLIATRLASDDVAQFLDLFYWHEVEEYHESEIPNMVLNLNESLLSLASTMADFTVLVHHLKLDELLWAGYTTHVQQRPVTYEQEMTSFERIQLATGLCAHHLIINTFDLSWESVITSAETLEYSAPPTFQYADMEAYIVLNSVVKFVSFQMTFFNAIL